MNPTCKKTTSLGFTLIELLVVISIISLLSSAVLASLSGAREEARYTAAESEIDTILDMITTAQGNEGGKSLINIASNCSDCSCRGGKQLRDIPSSDSCFVDMKTALQNIEDAAGPSFDGVADKIIRDPWGSPYLIDENEGESGNCSHGSLRSAGPDGVRGNSDDYAVEIPFGTSQCRNQ